MTNTIRQDVNILGTLSAQGITPELASVILNSIYKVGAIYISTDSTSPASFLGGTWERIQDKFLLSAGSSYSAGSEGGSATHTLTVDEIPSHYHDVYQYVSGNKIAVITSYAYADGGDLVYTLANNDNKIVNAQYNQLIEGIVKADYTGGGQPHNNMPPYLAVYMWRRIS